MLKSILSLLIISSFILFGFAQEKDNETLLTIDGQDVTKEEFIRVYTKNNKDAAFDKASLDEYLKLFVNFKLKVLEAEKRGMDTLPGFVKELRGYKIQLQKPYFTDEGVDEELIKEAYERMKYDIKASHILIKCDANTLPSDTLAAYNKLKDIQKKAKNGEDFEKLAKEYSEDPSAQQNSGNLGYLTAFATVYEFETAAYNTPVGEVSDIIRTKFGYHIVKVTDKRKNKGRIKTAHIMRSVPQGSSPEKDKNELEYINSVYDSLMMGEPFSKMAYNHSTDRGTSSKGGEIRFFGIGEMVPEFETEAFSLDTIGQISKPVRTSYGYHIIKLLEVDTLQSLEEERSYIKKRISKDVRANRGAKMVISRLEKEYNVTQYSEPLEVFYTAVDSSIYQGKWDGSSFQGGDEVVLTIADTLKYTQNDFAAFITNDKYRRQPNTPIKLIVVNAYASFVKVKLIDFEKSRLEDKYPEFKNLLKEYHDGILLFNLTDEMVWSKAVEDTVGLEKFYNENKNNYMWGDRVEATIYTFNSETLSKKISALAKKVAKKNLDIEKVKADFMAKELAKDSTIMLEIEKSKFSKGDYDITDAVSWEPGLKELVARDDKFILVYVNGKIAPESKQLNEARGLITADYQTYLETLWLKELREKYKIEINQEVFNSLIK